MVVQHHRKHVEEDVEIVIGEIETVEVDGKHSLIIILSFYLKFKYHFGIFTIYGGIDANKLSLLTNGFHFIFVKIILN